MRRGVIMVVGLVAAVLLAPSDGSAQQPTKEQLLLPPLPADWSPTPQGGIFGRSAPGVSTASPLAFGPNFGDVFFGGGYQAKTRNGGGDDGSLSGGFGLGNSQTAIGLEVVLVSASTVRSGLFERTMLALKAHKSLPGNSAIAFGMEGIELSGESGADPNWYAVASRVVALRNDGDDNTPFSQVTLNIGAGNGRFCGAEEVATDIFTTKDCSANVFASAGLRANKYIGLVADYTGQDINLGVSLAPFPKFPIVITPALVDVAGMANKEMRFTLGAGIGMRFR